MQIAGRLYAGKNQLLEFHVGKDLAKACKSSVQADPLDTGGDQSGGVPMPRRRLAVQEAAAIVRDPAQPPPT